MYNSDETDRSLCAHVELRVVEEINVNMIVAPGWLSHLSVQLLLLAQVMISLF